jgi:hypothetical protein
LTFCSRHYSCQTPLGFLAASSPVSAGIADGRRGWGGNDCDDRGHRRPGWAVAPKFRCPARWPHVASARWWRSARSPVRRRSTAASTTVGDPQFVAVTDDPLRTRWKRGCSTPWSGSAAAVAAFTTTSSARLAAAHVLGPAGSEPLRPSTTVPILDRRRPAQPHRLRKQHGDGAPRSPRRVDLRTVGAMQPSVTRGETSPSRPMRSPCRRATGLSARLAARHSRRRQRAQRSSPRQRERRRRHREAVTAAVLLGKPPVMQGVCCG